MAGFGTLASFACGADGASDAAVSAASALSQDTLDPEAGDMVAAPDVRVSCDADAMMTDLGWPVLGAAPPVGAAFIATLGYVGDEPCIAARFDSVLLGLDVHTAPLEPLVPVSVTRGLDVSFSSNVPDALRDTLRDDLIEPAEVVLENASVTWVETPPGGWLATPGNSGTDENRNRLFNATWYPQDQFIFIVTRVYSAERVTNLDGMTDGLSLASYSEYGGAMAAYDCPVLPLGEVGAPLLYDGIFMDASEGFGSVIVRSDLPRRFCPQLPGVDLEPGNGVLFPTAP